MANYRDIKGFNVQSKSSDPANGIAGDMYYNTTTGQFKAIKDGGAPIGTWASGNNMNTARSYLSGFGSQTSAIGAAGGIPPNSNKNVESYDGSSWTEVAEVNTAGNHRGGAGVVGTAGILVGGADPAAGPRGLNAVEKWNGTSWTEVAEIGTAGYGIACSGTSTAALGSGRYDYPPGVNSGATESWNGSAWTEVNDLNNARHYGAQAGPSTAALRTGGTPPPNGSYTESWNGTSWTEVTDLNNARAGILSGAGTQSSMTIAGVPNPTPAAYVEHWNGTAWTEVAENATKRQSLAGSKSSATSLAIFGGNTPAPAASNATEEFSADDFQIKTVTTS